MSLFQRKYPLVITDKDKSKQLNHDEEHLSIPHLLRSAPVPYVNWAAKTGVILDQGNIGSCTACATVSAVYYQKSTTPYAALFQYYCERAIMNTVSEDSGADMDTIIQSLKKYGICAEKLWAYRAHKFTAKPSVAAYNDAKRTILKKYKIVPNTLNDLKSALQMGRVILFGFTVYQSFENNDVATTGMIPDPKPEENILGGHCMLITGYDDTIQRVICKNSWGKGWGKNGYCYMTYNYIMDSDKTTKFYVLETFSK